jgi:hypothetical protein
VALNRLGMVVGAVVDRVFVDHLGEAVVVLERECGIVVGSIDSEDGPEEVVAVYVVEEEPCELVVVPEMAQQPVEEEQEVQVESYVVVELELEVDTACSAP